MNQYRKYILTSIVFVAAGTQLGAGCKSTPGDDGTYRRDPDPIQRDPDPYYSPQQDTQIYRPIDTVPLPRDARVASEGRGLLRYKAPVDGRIFLFDATDRFVIDDRAIYSGEEYIISPKDQRAWIDQTRVLDYSFDDHHEHRIYFLESQISREDRDHDTTRDKDRDRDRETHRQHDNTAGNPQKPTKPVAVNAPYPPTAKSIASGRNVELSFKAKYNGTAYLWDVDNQKLIETFILHAGDRLTVSSIQDQAAVNGKIVMARKGLARLVTYNLLFDVSK